MIVVTAEQMREMDRLTIEKYGVPSLALMERAGEGIAQAILERFSRMAKKGVLIVAGKGNNGGDGLVVARLLKKQRIPCEVALLACKDEVSSDSSHNLRAYMKLKGKVVEIDARGLDLLRQRMKGKGVLVDAILLRSNRPVAASGCSCSRIWPVSRRIETPCRWPSSDNANAVQSRGRSFQAWP